MSGIFPSSSRGRPRKDGERHPGGQLNTAVMTHQRTGEQLLLTTTQGMAARRFSLTTETYLNTTNPSKRVTSGDTLRQIRKALTPAQFAIVDAVASKGRTIADLAAATGRTATDLNAIFLGACDVLAAHFETAE